MGKLAEPVVTACNTEFYKAYAHARCSLRGLFAAQLPCVYDAADLKWIQIRLGE